MSTLAIDRGRELVIRRVFHAPRQALWLAWVDPQLARQWVCPVGFSLAELHSDPRPAGEWRTVLRAPDGELYVRRGEFEVVLAPERLVYTLIWDDHGPERATRVVVTFAERDGRTTMTFQEAPLPTVDWQTGERDEWGDAFERLKALVDAPWPRWAEFDRVTLGGDSTSRSATSVPLAG